MVTAFGVARVFQGTCGREAAFAPPTAAPRLTLRLRPAPCQNRRIPVVYHRLAEFHRLAVHRLNPEYRSKPLVWRHWPGVPPAAGDERV